MKVKVRINQQPDVRIEPGTAGWEAWMLPLCYAVPSIFYETWLSGKCLSVETLFVYLIFYQFDKLIHEGVVRANVASRPERPQDVDGLPAQRDHHEGHGGRAGPGNAHLTVDQNFPASGLKC